MTDNINKSTLDQVLINGLALGVIIIDREYRIKHWNLWMRQHTGIPEDQVEGLSILEKYPSIIERNMDVYLNNCFENNAPVFLSPVFHQNLIPITITLNGKEQQMIQNVKIFPLGVEKETSQIIIIIEDLTGQIFHEQEIMRLNRLLRGIRNINQLITQTDSKEELLAGTCRVMVEEIGYSFAWIGFVNEDDPGIEPVAQAGLDVEVFASMKEKWNNPEYDWGGADAAVKTGEVQVLENIQEIPEPIPWLAATEISGLKSACSVPLIADGIVYGVLTVDSAEPNIFQAEEVRLLEEISGDITFALKALDDRKKRRRAEAELHKSEERFRTIFETAQDWIFIKNRESEYVFVNPALVKLFDISAPELIGQTDSVIFDRDNVEKIQNSDHLVLVGETITDETIIQSDGRTRIFNVIKVPLKDGSGSIIGICGIGRDVTNQKQVEKVMKEHHDLLKKAVEERTAELESRVRQADSLNRGMVNLMEDSREIYLQLENTSQALEEANTELESFAYSAAHDLKAPLRAIEGYSQAVLDDYGTRLDDEGRNYANRITGVCHRMAGLIDDLLAYSHLSQSEIRMKPIELAPLIDKALENLENRIKETSARIEVEDPLPLVMANRSILLQLVENLISNALTFVTPGVEPKVRIRTHLEDGMVRLCVDDNGIGISEEDRGRIFRVFERLHGIETYPGTGIGLAIVRRGVEKMGGRVGLESESGKGSTFWIELPEGKKQTIEKVTVELPS